MIKVGNYGITIDANYFINVFSLQTGRKHSVRTGTSFGESREENIAIRKTAAKLNREMRDETVDPTEIQIMMGNTEKNLRVLTYKGNIALEIGSPHYLVAEEAEPGIVDRIVKSLKKMNSAADVAKLEDTVVGLYGWNSELNRFIGFSTKAGEEITNAFIAKAGKMEKLELQAIGA
jgi:hypothetical protein